MDRGQSFLMASGLRDFWSADWRPNAGFSPAKLPGLNLWFDAQEGSLSGDLVSTWNDRGPGARDVTQNVVGNMPDYLPGEATFNGRNVVQCGEGDSETQDWLSRTSETVTTATSGTIWAVVAQSAIEDRVILAVQHGTVSDRYFAVSGRVVSGAIKPAIGFRNGGGLTEGGVYADDAQAVLTPNQAYFLTFSSSDTALRVWVNGRQYGGGGAGTLTSFGAGNNGTWIGDIVNRDTLSLGARLLNGLATTTATGRMRIAELVSTAPEATASELATMHAYLSARYGIALSS